MLTIIAFVGWKGTWCQTRKDDNQTSWLTRCGTYWARCLGKDSRNCMKGLYYRFEAFEQFAIHITICLEPLRSVLKHVEEVVGGVTVLKVLSEGLRSKVYACLFGIAT